NDRRFGAAKTEASPYREIGEATGTRSTKPVSAEFTGYAATPSCEPGKTIRGSTGRAGLPVRRDATVAAGGLLLCGGWLRAQSASAARPTVAAATAARARLLPDGAGEEDGISGQVSDDGDAARARPLHCHEDIRVA